MNTEMRPGRNRIARAVARTEQPHRRKNARTDHHAKHDRINARLERQTEQHGKTAEHRCGKGIAAAEQQAEKVDRPRITRAIRNAFKTECFDLGDAAAHCLQLL